MSGAPVTKPKRPSSTANPLRKNPNPVLRRHIPAGARGAANGGARTPNNSTPSGTPGPSSAASSSSSVASLSSQAAAASRSADDGNYTDFNLRACSAAEIQGTRHHVLKFHSRSKVEPQKTFTQPVRFHRKDPRNLSLQLTLSEMQDVQAGEGDTAPKEPDVDMSVVAPDGGARRQGKAFQKKTRQVSGIDEATRRLRYEEYYPWIMEDFDGKNTWVGSYEAAQSDTYALFMFDKDGFKMIPADRWYKMTPRNKFATLSLEEAEKRMEKKQTAPRWIMKHIAEEQQANNPGGADVNMRRRFKTVESTHQPEAAALSRNRDEDDEIDFDEEFADDEEAPIAEGNDDEVKEIEEKIKKERRGRGSVAANGEVADDENADENEPKIDKEGRRLRKYLISLEKNTNYSSDDEENPYVSEQEDDSDDELFGTNNDTTTVKQEPQDQSLSQAQLQQLKPFVKKEIGPLPPGMVVIQLPPHILSTFPRNVWNPHAKRRREESPDAVTKKIKTERSPSPPARSSAGPGSGPSSTQASPQPSSAVDENDPNLLTEDDVKNIIRRGGINTRQLLAELKPKLKKHPSNPERLKSLVRKVARLQEGSLVLRD
uniref:Transcription initiation factor IIF subunit alpha n=1 Tax=Blastobotrys adeninivorans TaxID=409370 RepID=A0A060TEF7_BLAAD